jgi:hypothetical protein
MPDEWPSFDLVNTFNSGTLWLYLSPYFSVRNKIHHENRLRLNRIGSRSTGIQSWMTEMVSRLWRPICGRQETAHG